MIRTLHVLAKDMPSSSIRQLSLLTDHMAESGHQSSICSIENNTRQRDRVRFYLDDELLTFCSQSLRWDPTFIRRLGRTITQNQPDIVHYWGPTPNAAVWLANQLHGNRPIIASVSELEASQSSRSSLQIDIVQRWLATRTHRVVTRCGAADAQPSRLQVKPNSDLHATLGVDPNIKFIAARVDLVHRNRCQDLIWALEQLRVLHEDVQLVIIGEGDQEHELREYADRATTHDGVAHFIRPQKGCADQDRLSQCFCLWHAGELDESDSILQAMRCGLPVIVTESSAARDLVVHDQTGFVVPSGDAAEFARKTNFLLSDETLRNRLGTAGRTRVESEFSVDRMVRDYVLFYESALSAKKAA